MSKTYTIQIEIEEGWDEFWESNPTPQQVLKVVDDELFSLQPKSVKIVKIIDENTYDLDSD